MTPLIHAPGSNGQHLQDALAPAAGGLKPKSVSVDKAESKGLDEAARQFEAVFLRQMLSSLERAAGTQGGGKQAGGNLYGSMLVDAVADAISRAGGIGLASMLKHSIEPKLGRTATAASAETPRNQPAEAALRIGNSSQKVAEPSVSEPTASEKTGLK